MVCEGEGACCNRTVDRWSASGLAAKVRTLPPRNFSRSLEDDYYWRRSDTYGLRFSFGWIEGRGVHPGLLALVEHILAPSLRPPTRRHDTLAVHKVTGVRHVLHLPPDSPRMSSPSSCAGTKVSLTNPRRTQLAAVNQCANILAHAGYRLDSDEPATQYRSQMAFFF